jgi:hypothetical protein
MGINPTTRRVDVRDLIWLVTTCVQGEGHVCARRVGGGEGVSKRGFISKIGDRNMSHRNL